MLLNGSRCPLGTQNWLKIVTEIRKVVVSYLLPLRYGYAVLESVSAYSEKDSDCPEDDEIKDQAVTDQKEHGLTPPGSQVYDPLGLINTLQICPISITNAASCCVDRDYDGIHSPRRDQRHKPAAASRRASESAVTKTRRSKMTTNNKRKRNSRRSGDDGDNYDSDEDSDDGNYSGPEGGPGPDSQNGKQILACPFYKRDSMKHILCGRLKLSRVRDVKQHLNRRHRRPIYCPICGTIFKESGRCEEHIQAQSCQRPPLGFQIDGVTESQSRDLAKRVNRSLSEKDQWFTIWNILFENSERPESPYLSGLLEETVGMVYDYWRRHQQTFMGPTVTGGEDQQSVFPFNIVPRLLRGFLEASRAAMSPITSTTANNEPISHDSSGSTSDPSSTSSSPESNLASTPCSITLHQFQQQQQQQQPLSQNTLYPHQEIQLHGNSYYRTDTDPQADMTMSPTQFSPCNATSTEPSSSQILSTFPINGMSATYLYSPPGDITGNFQDGFSQYASSQLQQASGGITVGGQVESLALNQSFTGLVTDPGNYTTYDELMDDRYYAATGDWANFELIQQQDWDEDIHDFESR